MFLGPHGAGLAAMLFLPKDASVLELRQDHKRDALSGQYSCFQTMAWAAGIHFEYLFGKGNRETIMSVNVSLVMEYVRRLRARWMARRQG